MVNFDGEFFNWLDVLLEQRFKN